MTRVARVVIPGVPYHVIQRGNYRANVFDSDKDYLQYCRWMNLYTRKNELAILAYCLMTNHVHFVAIPRQKMSLALTFGVVHMRYAQYKHEMNSQKGHFWQGRFNSIPLEEGHLFRAISYIEDNPVRAQLVNSPEEYRWSSARFHSGLVKVADINLEERDSPLRE